MTIVRWSRPALADYRDIINWIQERNPNAARRIRNVINDRLALLATMPRMGRIGRVADTRELVIAGTPYIVVYELGDDDQHVFILRVLHGARRWPP